MNEALLTQLRILKLSQIKPNFSELGRLYNLDRRTVKKYYDGYSGKPAHHDKPSKLDAHYDLIQQKLQIKGTTVKAVYEFIISERDSNIGTYSNFNKYIKSKGLKPRKTIKGHPYYETAPGIQAQVDWKEDMHIANCHGEIFTFQVFDYILGYSRYPVFTYKLSRTRQDVFDCLIASFKATGGVPREILFDNMSSVVSRDGDRKKNISNQVKSFANDFGFEIKLCKPRHAYTKGKVEVINKFLSWIYPYEGEFETEEELVEILEKVAHKVRTHICKATNVPPLLLLQKEKEYLQPLPCDAVIDSYLSHDRQTTVRKDSMVTYMSCKYSVHPDYIGKPVNLRVVDTKLEIYCNTELIARHELSEKRLNYKYEHYQALISYGISNEEHIEKLAEENLRLLDALL